MDDFVCYGDFRRIVLNSDFDRGELIGVVLINIVKEYNKDHLYLEVWEKIFDRFMYEDFSREYLNLFFVCRSLSNYNSTILDLVIELDKLDKKGEFFLDSIIENTTFTTKDLYKYPTICYSNDDKERNTFLTFNHIINSLPNYSIIDVLKSFGKILQIDLTIYESRGEGYYNNLENI